MSTQSPSKKQMFRPYFNQDELIHNLNLLSEDMNSPLSPTAAASRRLHSKLSIFAFKIDSGLITPSYIVSSSSKLSTLEKLGGSTPEEAKYLAGEMSQEEEAEYLTQLMNPIAPD